METRYDAGNLSFLLNWRVTNEMEPRRFKYLRCLTLIARAGSRGYVQIVSALMDRKADIRVTSKVSHKAAWPALEILLRHSM